MESKLNKIMNETSDQLEHWTDTLNKHNALRNDILLRSDEYYDKTIYEIAEVLKQISDRFIQYSAVKDKFDNSKMHIHFSGPALIIKSEKMNSDFNFGIGEQGIYLETYLLHSENMRQMDDDFYEDFLSLDDLGYFELMESERYGKETREKYGDAFAGTKSKIFKIIRNNIVGHADNIRHPVAPNLQISWNNEYDIFDMLRNGCQAFHLFYKLSYQLWKISDLKSKTSKKNI